MPFVDFAELKSRVSIEKVAEMLSLELAPHGAQLRGPCPVCRSGGERALVVTPSKQAFYCFGAKSGGDLIALVTHVRGVGANEAANRIARHFGTGTGTRTGTSLTDVAARLWRIRAAHSVSRQIYLTRRLL